MPKRRPHGVVAGAVALGPFAAGVGECEVAAFRVDERQPWQGRQRVGLRSQSHADAVKGLGGIIARGR